MAYTFQWTARTLHWEYGPAQQCEILGLLGKCFQDAALMSPRQSYEQNQVRSSLEMRPGAEVRASMDTEW